MLQNAEEQQGRRPRSRCRDHLFPQRSALPLAGCFLLKDCCAPALCHTWFCISSLSLNLLSYKTRGFLGGAGGGEPACQCRRQMWVQSLGREDPLEVEMATHSSILAWRVPCTEEPGRLQTMGKDRVRDDSSDLVSLHTHFVCVCV